MTTTIEIIQLLSDIPGLKSVFWTTQTNQGSFDMIDDELLTTTYAELRLRWDEQPMIAIMVYEFTDRFDAKEGDSIKRLHAFCRHKKHAAVKRLSASDARWAYESAQDLHPLPDVEYA